MRPAPNALIAAYRQRVPGYENTGAGNNGLFLVPCGAVRLAVIASDQEGWDHISVSLPDRCPTWLEMDHVKSLFFMDSEIAFQLHVRKKDWISNHEFCLHLWRSQSMEIPLPPGWMVGDKSIAPEQMERMSPADLRRFQERLDRQREK